MRALKGRQHLVKIAPGLLRRQAAEPVVASELHNDHGRMQAQYRRQPGYRVFGGSAAGALIYDLVVVAARIQVALQGFGVSLPGLQPVTCCNAVAITDK